MSDEGTNSVRSAVRLPTRTSVYIETKDGVFDVMPENTSVEKLLFSSKRDLEKNNKIAFTSTVSSAVYGTSQDVSVYSLGRIVRRHGAGDPRNTAAIIEEYSLKA